MKDHGHILRLKLKYKFFMVERISRELVIMIIIIEEKSKIKQKRRTRNFRNRIEHDQDKDQIRTMIHKLFRNLV
jgi:hypothetical protein